MRHIALLVMGLIFSVTLSHAASVEGYWYGKGYQPSVRKTLEWLTIRRADGTFSVEFREYDNCQLKFVHIETGLWTVSGSVIAAKVLTLNGRPVRDTAYFNDTYKILELDDRKMLIRDEKTKEEWMHERVTPDFAFPDPDCKNMS